MSTIRVIAPAHARAWIGRSAAHEKLIEAQRQKRWVARLKLQIFDPATTFLRLRDGKILPCSRCGAETPENLFEVFCADCISEMAAVRPKKWQRGHGGYAPAPTQSLICVRCREPLGDDDDCWRCESCLLAAERKLSGVQPELCFDEPEPERIPRQPQPQRYCIGCGSAVKGRVVLRCKRCSVAHRRGETRKRRGRVQCGL
jgi:hypothetical protein